MKQRGVSRYMEKWGFALYRNGTGGDQVLKGNQNKTLYYSNTNGVEVHLFEVLKKKVYTYRGIVKLVDEPYKGRQPDINGNMRDVWMFPVMPVVEAAQNALHEMTEPEIARLSDKELARYAAVKNVNKEPKKTETVVYYRDPYLKQMVKRIAEGKCQYCGEDAPFIDKQGKPYLETHHVMKLADGGKDIIDNVVAICPNCHRKVHVLNDEKDIVVLQGVARNNKKQFERMLSMVEVFDKGRKKKNDK